MKKVLVADLIKAVKEEVPEIGDIEDSGIDHIEYLIQEVEAGRMELDDAQEDAWVYYGYPEGGGKSEVRTSDHPSSTWGELFQGETVTTITVDYSPDFESLGDTLDDDPMWDVYVTIESNHTPSDGPDYDHLYSGPTIEQKSLAAISDLEETESVMRWFNTYCGDHRFGSN
jgi:hypothetical protein